MAGIWSKLNLKGETRIVVVDPPESFEPQLDELRDVRLARSLRSAAMADFLIAFVSSRERVSAVAAAVTGMASGDVKVWLAYPKASSKRYRCDFNRDSGWEPLGQAGFEAVRQVAIDEDWSALRFRRVEHITSLKRDPKRTLSAAGRSRVRDAQRPPEPSPSKGPRKR
jgi:hypothetical protein